MDLVLPTKSYEFALMRRAMIASETPALRSMFRPESIRFCESSNVDSFTAAIVDLYEHPDKRQALVENAAQDYAPYRWELMSARYQAVLNALVGGREPPAT
jgi:glycosyltransferase involved in cell wall biosynthesis